MVDLSEMRYVQVDPERRRAWVDGGAIWRDVDRETQAFALAVPGGLISDTGVAGLTLSGGIGWLSSRHGLSIDNLVSAEVVTAEARLLPRERRRERRPVVGDARAGAATSGSSPAFEFVLHPAGPAVMFCAPLYPVSAGAGPIRFWRDFLADKSGDVGSVVEFSTIPSDPDYPEQYWGERVYTIAAVAAGDADEGERLLQPLRELGDPVADFSGQMSYCDIQQLFDTLIPFGRYRAYWKSHYLSGLGDDADRPRSSRATRRRRRPTRSRRSGTSVAQRRAVAAADTAFGDRSMPYMMSIDAVWEAPEDDEVNIAWTRAFWERMTAVFRPGAHLPQLPGPRRGGRRARAAILRSELRQARGDQAALRPAQHGSASIRTSSPAECPRPRRGRAPRMSIVIRVLDLAGGSNAFQARDWARARDLLREALSTEAPDEALEMLAVASWWLDDGTTAWQARERQFRARRQAGDDLGAARTAISLAWDATIFGSDTAVARGWAARARRLLEDLPPSEEHAWLAVRRHRSTAPALLPTRARGASRAA